MAGAGPGSSSPAVKGASRSNHPPWPPAPAAGRKGCVQRGGEQSPKLRSRPLDRSATASLCLKPNFNCVLQPFTPHLYVNPNHIVRILVLFLSAFSRLQFGAAAGNLHYCRSGRSVAWLARLFRVQEVVSSNLTAPTIFPMRKTLAKMKIPPGSKARPLALPAQIAHKIRPNPKAARCASP